MEDPGLPAFALPPVSDPRGSLPVSGLSFSICSVMFRRLIWHIDAIVILGKGSRQYLVTGIAFCPFNHYWLS